jgi:cell wall-associated NlpC family hydrolase
MANGPGFAGCAGYRGERTASRIGPGAGKPAPRRDRVALHAGFATRRTLSGAKLTACCPDAPLPAIPVDIHCDVTEGARVTRLHALFFWLSLMGPLMLLHACAGAPRRAEQAAVRIEAPRGDPAHRNEVLFRALGLVGTPYRYGGTTPEGGFDCSGLVGFVYRDAAGVALPRASAAIAALAVPRVKRAELVAGDLVFFGSRRGVNHIGIYVGEGRFVHAPSSGGTVRLDSLEGAYWKDSFLDARRVLR